MMNFDYTALERYIAGFRPEGRTPEAFMHRLTQVPDYIRRLRHLLETAPKPRPKGVFFFQFIDREVAYSVRDLRGADVEKEEKFRTLLAEEGVLIMWRGRWYVSSGLTETDVDKTLECVNRVMGRL